LNRKFCTLSFLEVAFDSGSMNDADIPVMSQ
jgi:hypothetical protein